MRVSIIGFGRSGRAAARLAEKLGYEVFVSERERISGISYLHEIGGHTERILDADLIVVSPGVREFPLLEKAREMGIEVIDEIEFAYRYLRGKLIAVTGTNGKTTTCGMIHSILKTSGRKTLLGGNIYPGVPLSELVRDTDEKTFVVVEVSSFQLERITLFRPDVGVVMNISPDHMDRYESFSEYAEAKKRLFINQKGDDFAVLNRDDPVVSKWDVPSKKLFFSREGEGDIFLNGGDVRLKNGEKVFSREDIKLVGDFFIEDGMAAAISAIAMGVGIDAVRKGLREFRGIPHRMEVILEKPLIINNSMCTNPVAFRSSLSAMKGAVVIMGGRLKNLDPYHLVDAAIEYAGFVILFGESKETLAEIFEKKGFMDYYVARDLEDAVRYSRKLNPESLILSPGGASQDMFRNFVERGEVFKALVKEYYNE